VLSRTPTHLHCPIYSLLVMAELIFEIEQSFDPHKFRDWMQVHSHSIGYCAIGVYLLSIKPLQIYMQRREAFNLKLPLIVWNALLAVFSMVGAYRCWSALLTLLREEDGWMASICGNEFYYTKPAAFWWAAFSASKIPELVDTYFIILRKRRLIFLHWYHHATVLAYSWFTYIYWHGGPMWYESINFTVHAIMYTYYAVMATKLIRVPKPLAMAITSLQILQMIVGVCVQIALWKNYTVPGCKTSKNLLIGGTLMYASYLVLFVNFFLNTYSSSKTKRKTQ